MPKGIISVDYSQVNYVGAKSVMRSNALFEFTDFDSYVHDVITAADGIYTNIVGATILSTATWVFLRNQGSVNLRVSFDGGSDDYFKIQPGNWMVIRWSDNSFSGIKAKGEGDDVQIEYLIFGLFA